MLPGEPAGEHSREHGEDDDQRVEAGPTAGFEHRDRRWGAGNPRRPGNLTSTPAQAAELRLYVRNTRADLCYRPTRKPLDDDDLPQDRAVRNNLPLQVAGL